MAEEIAVKNGRNSKLEGLVTLKLTLDRVILHTFVHHSSTSTYMPNFIKIEETSCVKTDIWDPLYYVDSEESTSKGSFCVTHKRLLCFLRRFNNANDGTTFRTVHITSSVKLYETNSNHLYNSSKLAVRLMTCSHQAKRSQSRRTFFEVFLSVFWCCWLETSYINN